MYQSTETPAPRLPRHSGRWRGINAVNSGIYHAFNNLLSPGGGEINKMPCHPGHERGFNVQAVFEAGTATGNCILLFFRNNCLRASTHCEICGSVEVFRSSIILFLNLAECYMQCSDKVTGIFIGARKCKCTHV